MSLPLWLTSTLASDAAAGKGVMSGVVRPLRPGQRIAAIASTLAVAEGDNLFFKDAVARGGPAGPVLVIGGSPTAHRAVMGGILATAAAAAGFTAVVTDGVIRDSVEIAELGLAVWCRGATPVAGSKNGPGGAGELITCAGVLVSPGDAVIADDDGVVVWPAARIAELVVKAKVRMDSDAERLAQIRAGKGDI